MEEPETEITLETIIIQPMVNNDAVIAEIGVPEINAKIMIQEEVCTLDSFKISSNSQRYSIFVKSGFVLLQSRKSKY